MAKIGKKWPKIPKIAKLQLLKKGPKSLINSTAGGTQTSGKWTTTHETPKNGQNWQKSQKSPKNGQNFGCPETWRPSILRPSISCLKASGLTKIGPPWRGSLCAGMTKMLCKGLFFTFGGLFSLNFAKKPLKI